MRPQEFNRRERRKHKRLLDHCMRALIACDGDHKSIAEVRKFFPLIDTKFLWPEFMRRVGRIEDELNPWFRCSFYHTWSHNGDHIRQEVNDDLLLIRALRKLLPPYGVGGKKLYRGETFDNWTRRTYGMSWTSKKRVARCFAEHPRMLWAKGGSVLLEAYVPEKAIIARMPKGHYHYDDELEYVVDRTMLQPNSVRVVSRWIRLNDWPTRKTKKCVNSA